MKKELIEIIYFIVILSNLFLVFGYGITFWKGYHNIDLGYNIVKINDETNSNYLDIGSDDKIRTGREVYSLGLDQIEKSNIALSAIIMMDIFMLIISLCNIQEKK